MSRLLFCGLMLVGWLAGCAVNPAAGPDEAALPEVSLEREIVVGGNSYDQALQKLGGVYPDPELAAYVDRIGQRLARGSRRPEPGYRFAVVNASAPNAFALPEGAVVITRGLLGSVENEAQLAALLGHEIGHLAAAHNTRELQRSPTDAADDGKTGYAELLARTGALTAELLNRSYSREQEYEADRLAVDCLARAGYSLQGAVQLQRTFSEKSAGASRRDWLGNMFRTHPFAPDRLPAVQRYINGTYAHYRSDRGLEPAAYARQAERLNATRAAYRLYDQAREAENRQQSDRAIELYHQAMQQAPDHGLLLTALGMAYLRKEDPVPAKRYLLRAVRVDPGYFQSRLGLGYLYLQDREAAAAVEHLEAAVKLLPTVEGVYLLAAAETLSGNLTRARQLYRAVAQTDRTGHLGQAAAERLRRL